jgi:hypothetical protein
MAIIDRQIIDNVVSRGLGDSGGENKADSPKSLYKITSNIEANIYEDKYYYPATGCFSTEESIDGWRWNRTLPQEVSPLEHGNSREIKSYLGGYNYNLEEGLSESDYRGNLIEGCELVGIQSKESKWLPEISKGSYSIKGRNKNLYSKNSYCKVLASESTNLSEVINFLNADTMQVAIFERDINFVKKIFREYKEDNIIYKYSLSKEGILTIEASKLYYKVGADDLLAFEDLEAACERVGVLKKGGALYLNYFPVQNISLYVKEGENSVKVVGANDYTVDEELGCIKYKGTADEGSICYAAYKAVPRLDCELIGSGFFVGNIDLKSHKWERANGLIELSPEDKHVTRLALSKEGPSENDIYYGGGFESLSCIAYNSKDLPVDEVDIIIECIDTNREVYFEGNLIEYKAPSNSDGKVFTSVNAPLTSESSSYYFKVNPNNPDSYFKFPIPQEEIIQGTFNESVIFEVLPIDPFYGTEGLTFDVAYQDGMLKVVDYQLNKNDYAMFRNLLEIAETYETSEAGTNNKFVYNSGLVKFDYEDRSFSVGITDIQNKNGEVYIKVEAGFNTNLLADVQEITIYKKNSKILKADSNLGVERVLYRYKEEDSSYELLTPQSYAPSGGVLQYTELANRRGSNQNDSLVKGYRIYVPRKTKIQAKCIDPATGGYIYSNTVDFNLVLRDIYKSELYLEDLSSGNELASKIDTANFISYDPVGNNVYVESNG